MPCRWKGFSAAGASTARLDPAVLSAAALFHVLNLFADFFHVGFASYHELRNIDIVCFGAERVQLARDFLDHELEGAPDRLGLAKMMGKLREMAVEPRQFFADVGFVSKEDHLL